MAIAYVAPVTTGGVIVAGTTSAAPVVPDSAAAGHLLLMSATAKPDTVTFPTIAGWTKQVDLSVGSGVDGSGTGKQRIALYTRTADGSEAGATVTVTPTGTANMTLAGIGCWSSGTGFFSTDIATADVTTNSTAFSGTKGGSDRETTGDVMWFSPAGTANSNFGSTTVTATGATYGTANERSDVGTNNGNRARLSINDRPVTAGTASAATVATSTASAATNGGVTFVRLREAAAPAGPPRPTIVNRIPVFNRIYSRW